MQENQELLEQLQEMLHWKKNSSYYAAKLGITVEEVETLRQELKGRKKSESVNYIQTDLPQQELTYYVTTTIDSCSTKVNNEKGTLESIIETSFEPKDDIELAQLHKINLDKYKISNYWTKQKSNGKFFSSVFATLKKPTEFSVEDFAKFIINYKSSYTPATKEVPFQYKESVDVVISLADFHLDKLDVVAETIKQKKDLYLKTLNNLISRVYTTFTIDTIVFVIGNDVFQTDTIQGTTTSGTPVDVAISWNQAYEEVFDLMVSAITELSSKCSELKIVLVQGNHARTKEYYLAHSLQMYFKSDSSIVFDREFDNVKHLKLGDNFFGFHHGNTKIDDLPLVFATNSKSCIDFANATSRTIITGDKHYYLAKEIKGVRVHQMPSLSGTDRWHKDNNFVNSTRSGLALVFHPVDGKIAEFESRI